VRLVTRADGVDLDVPRFEVVHGRDVDKVDASMGVAKGGKAVSPYDHLVIDGDYIKSTAQAGGMTQVLYAVAIRKPDGTRTFRAPMDEDFAALSAAETRFSELEPLWSATEIL